MRYVNNGPLKPGFIFVLPDDRRIDDFPFHYLAVRLGGRSDAREMHNASVTGAEKKGL